MTGETRTGTSLQDQPHILLVDDEAFIRDALELYFESNGFEVSTACDGNSALKIFSEQANSIDLVLLDLVMPGMHGLDVLRNMKKTDPSAQVIIATGCNSMDNAFEALRLGAIDYITKPILDFEDDLLKTVEAALGGHARRKDTAGSTGNEMLMESDAQTDSPASPQQAASPTGPIEELARLGGSRLSQPREQARAWNTLKEAFGVHAALVINKTGAGSWQCLQNWGFMDLGAPRDLWHADENGAGDEIPGWSGVLHVAFCGNPGEDLLLLLFFRSVATSRPGNYPLETLAAVFSHVYRDSPCNPDTTQSVTANAVDPRYNT